MVVCPRMSTGPSDDDDGDDAPPTRSYVDALLRGNLSVDQVASLRAEIASRAEEESARLARSYPPPAPSSPPSSPSSSPRSPRSYSPSSQPSSRPSSRGGSHPPSGPPPVSWPFPSSYAPPPADDDDQRTVARVYRPSSPVSPLPFDLPPPPDSDPAPVSYVPPDDIAHPYVFEDEPTDDEPEAGNLTAVHIYSASEIVEMVDLGDLGDLTGQAAPTQALAPAYGALLVETYLSALGGTMGVPCLAVHPAEVPSLPLGPQAAFVLSRIDGGSSVEDVLDMSGLPRVETLRILYELLQQGIIRVEEL